MIHFELNRMSYKWNARAVANLSSYLSIILNCQPINSKFHDNFIKALLFFTFVQYNAVNCRDMILNIIYLYNVLSLHSSFNRQKVKQISIVCHRNREPTNNAVCFPVARSLRQIFRFSSRKRKKLLPKQRSTSQHKWMLCCCIALALLL